MGELPRAETARNCLVRRDGQLAGCGSPGPAHTSTFEFSRQKCLVGFQGSRERFSLVANTPLALVRVLVAKARSSNRREFGETPHDTARPARIAATTVPWREPLPPRDTSASSD